MLWLLGLWSRRRNIHTEIGIRAGPLPCMSAIVHAAIDAHVVEIILILLLLLLWGVGVSVAMI